VNVTKEPLDWADAHHVRSWIDGGPTSLDNLVLVCRRHHGWLHDPDHGWQVRLGLDRLPEFIPPPWIDASGRPRRNLYHPRT
jgi:HNH endonuclease